MTSFVWELSSVHSSLLFFFLKVYCKKKKWEGGIFVPSEYLRIPLSLKPCPKRPEYSPWCTSCLITYPPFTENTHARTRTRMHIGTSARQRIRSLERNNMGSRQHVSRPFKALFNDSKDVCLTQPPPPQKKMASFETLKYQTTCHTIFF